MLFPSNGLPPLPDDALRLAVTVPGMVEIARRAWRNAHRALAQRPGGRVPVPLIVLADARRTLAAPASALAARVAPAEPPGPDWSRRPAAAGAGPDQALHMGTRPAAGVVFARAALRLARPSRRGSVVREDYAPALALLAEAVMVERPRTSRPMCRKAAYSGPS